MDEELNSLQLDSPRFGKSKEQLAKHTIDSQFETKPIEKSLHLLRKGDDVQKLSVIQALPRLLQLDANATLTRVLPRIQQELPKSSCEFHIATSKIFKLLIESKVQLNLMNAVLQGCDSKDPIVANAWTDTLLGVMQLLPADQIRNNVLTMAVSKSQLNNPVHARVASCKILGQVAVHPSMTPLDVKTVILPLVQSLCQDCFQDVRAAMCSQLPSVAQGLGEDFVRSNLLPSLVELASDDNMNVRSSAVAAVALIIPYLTKPKTNAAKGAAVDRDIDVETVVPLIKRLCDRSMEEGDTTYPSIAKELGRILDSLLGSLEANDCVWFLNFYKILSAKGRTPPTGRSNKAKAAIDVNQAVMCREQCAFNLPAVTFFVTSRIPLQLEVWHVVFADLAVDSCFIVRKTVAGSVHEIARILGPQCKIIKDDVVKLLRDDAEEVLHMLLPHIGTILELFLTHGVLSKENTTQATLEIARALLKSHSELSKRYSWRHHTFFFEQLEHLPNCFPSDFIHQYFTPVLMSCVLEARSKPIRSQAARTLLVLLRYNVKEMHRKWIRDNLVSGLRDSKSCYTRDLFIRTCVHAMDVFSNSYFKKFFFESILSLTDDPISNIRYCVVQTFPELARMLVMPDDRNLFTMFQTACQKLELVEKDKDVKDLLKVKLREVRSIGTTPKQEFLIEDKRKQDEENKIFQDKNVTAQVNRSTARRISAQPTVTGNPQKAPVIVRSTSAPPRAGPRNGPRAGPRGNGGITPRDMSFLEQHFYIDAGVALPRDKLSVDLTKPPLDLTNLKHQLDLVDNNENIVGTSDEMVSLEDIDVETITDMDHRSFTINMTDDVKVNLRKTSSKSRLAPPKVGITTVDGGSNLRQPKRYSSVISTTCLESPKKKTLNRRSLNIAAGDNSRIPVVSKKPEADTDRGNSPGLSLKDIGIKSSRLDSPKSFSNVKSRPRSEVLISLDAINKTDDNNKPIGGAMKKTESLIGNSGAITKVKENVPVVTSSIKSNVPIKCSIKEISPKASGLPVFKRRAQSEMRR